MRRWLAAGAGIAVMCVVAHAQPVGSGDPLAVFHVRANEDRLRRLVDRGYQRSATFHELIDALNSSRMIVMVDSGRCQRGAKACLNFVGRGGPFRYLRVKLAVLSGSEAEHLSLLAHELQHALEIAEHPDVIDAPSLERLYATIGWDDGAGYETRRAIETGRNVERELLWTH